MVSLSIVGKWFQRRLKWAMGLYALLLSLGFVTAFVVAERYAQSDWRTVWGAIAWILLFVVPLAWLITRDSPEACGLFVDGQDPGSAADEAETAEFEMTVSQALATPAFWIFAIGTSLFNVISSGVLLFNESILAERGFPSETYYTAMAIGTLTGLVGNVAAGWLISRGRIAKVTAAALVVLAGSLIALGALGEYWQVMCWTAVNGAVGGVITVVFFAVWSSLYGRQHLGKIQGAAQMLTVFASAIGPLLFAEVKDARDPISPF